ncbi:zinc finger protein ztf-16 [Lutzomyia longipalpis]|uniref:C2H2-type domain-containing protein n=2 Tax=Lutzomyia longipalpis TaxID=7200 RepID=A0A1B0CDE9_LUTLO|nr:zinc finger protein ztf-16 [Lutzomyia longipalpis]XP_055691637.1 zinc finger protein ztf-16 [Lutzomyia longipalpis]
MSGEADSAGGGGAQVLSLAVEPPSTNDDAESCDRVSASNYDSGDGALLLRCERCDAFETKSRALLLAHVCKAAPPPAVKPDVPLQSAPTVPPPVESEPESQPAAEARHHRKLFECDVCNMKFSNGANMRRHKMRHTGVKPYECRVCQKRFFRKDHLAEHFTTHTKTLPYHCPICNRGFQRQIAMRAHFQNEHVGQHDLVKTCPLCSYRAGTMKSLRVHFFNRHGIDLDNPGPGAPSSLLLALDSQNAGQLLPQLVAAAAPTYSDSGDSLRSAENATPPMHFLTPHVEISMADNADTFAGDPAPTNSTGLEIQPCPSSGHPNGGSPSSPHSADSNSNAPTSSHSLMPSMGQSSRHMLGEGNITPSISLIPIKQEPNTNDEYAEGKIRPSEQTSPTQTAVSNSGDSSVPSSSLTSLIKVSPLKSLLREDLKRRISARASSRASRNGSVTNNNNNATMSNQNTSLGGPLAVSPPDGQAAVVATTSNGAITSTGPENELLALRSKRNLQCLFCGIEFPDQTLYFLHKGCHSESNPWKCNICGEQCNNVYEFNSHLLSKSHQ